MGARATLAPCGSTALGSMQPSSNEKLVPKIPFYWEQPDSNAQGRKACMFVIVRVVTALLV